jgi:hypothetical protein
MTWLRFAYIVGRQLMHEHFNLFLVVANAAVWAVLLLMVWAAT